MQHHSLLSTIIALIGLILALLIQPASGQGSAPTAIAPPSVQVLSTSISQSIALPMATAVMPSATPEDAERSRVPSAVYGWQRFESIDLIQMVGYWELKQANNASDGAYHRSDNAAAIIRYPFVGAGLRVGYRVQHNGGSFRIVIDGQTVAEIDSEQDSNAYSVSTAEYFVDDEYHLLDIVSQVSSDGAAMVGIDYVEIFQSPPVPYVEGNADVASDWVVDV